MGVPHKTRIPFPLVIIVALLLSIATAFAYERDIHYSATLAFAIAEGWSVDEARVIAGAAQGVDENRATIAALEFDVVAREPQIVNGESYYMRGPIHQAKKNFFYHCFSEVGDKRSQIEAGVGATSEARRQDAAKVTRSDVTPPRVDALVAIGVAVHCIQDSYSHNGYGGRCPKLDKDKTTYPGNCYGHTKDSAKDGFARLFGGRTNPDHPAVRNINDLASALDATRRYLRDARKLMYAAQSGTDLIKPKDFDQLLKALSNPDTKRLDDEVRMACNHEVIAAWLYRLLPANGARDGLQQATKPASKECMSVFGADFLERRLDLGEPLYPRLSPDARANRLSNPAKFSVKNPPYVMVGEKDIADLRVEEVSHQQHSCTQDECVYSFAVRVSNVGQAKSAAGYLLIAVMPIDDQRLPFGFNAPLSSVAPGEKIVVQASTRGPPHKDYLVHTDIQPRPNATYDWRDANVHNDSANCGVFDGKMADQPDRQSGARCTRLERPPRLTFEQREQLAGAMPQP